MTEPRKLGLLPATPTKPRLRLSTHLTGVAPAPAPAAVDYLSDVPGWEMYRNDEIGDCGPASVAHFVTSAGTYGDGTPYVATIDEVIDLYSRVSGFNPDTGAFDDGVVMQDLLNEARKGGLGGQRILAFAQVDLTNYDEVCTALDLFGGLLIGVNMPLAAERQVDAGQAWDVVGGVEGIAGSWGGHAVHVGRYDRPGGFLECTTWGQVQRLSEAWWRKYVGEAWVVVTDEWVRENGTSPAGLDLHGLGEELARMTGGPNPIPSSAPDPEPEQTDAPPAPEPAPATPTPEPVESELRALVEAFAVEITPWLGTRHYSDNRVAQATVRGFLAAANI